MMMKMIAQQNRYEELVELLTTYNKHYYTLDNPLVSDKEYDKLYDELVALETAHPEWMRSDSPTQRVGGEVLDKFEKKEHTTQLYSLDKAQSFDDLLKFDKDVKKVVKNPQYTVEQKMDGLAFVTSHTQLFEESRTRGTGKIGEIVSNQIKTIKSIPLRISYPQKVEAQGEVFMPRSKFVEYNNKLLEAFHEEVSALGTDIKEEDMRRLQNKYAPLKNPRNGAAGALRNLDPKITASRPLDAFVYNVPYIEGKEFATQAEMMDFLKEEGFKVNPYFHVCNSMEEVIELIKEMEDKRDDLDWDIDGMVIKVNDLKQRDLLGYTSKFPKWAIAYKFEAIEEKTTLRDVSWQVGRTGTSKYLIQF